MLKRLEIVYRVASSAALLLLFGLIILQVILRYGFSFSPYFTEEIGRYALVWCVLLGAAASVRNGDHISVTLLRESIGERRFRPIGA